MDDQGRCVAEFDTVDVSARSLPTEAFRKGGWNAAESDSATLSHARYGGPLGVPSLPCLNLKVGGLTTLSARKKGLVSFLCSEDLREIALSLCPQTAMVCNASCSTYVEDLRKLSLLRHLTH